MSTNVMSTSGSAAECEAKFDPAYMVLVPRRPTPEMVAACPEYANAIYAWESMIGAWDAQQQEAIDLHDSLESAASTGYKPEEQSHV